MITVRSTINIAGQTVPQIIPVVRGDTGRSILFTLADFTIPQGSTATYYVQKPSGEAVYNVATIDGNTVLVELTAQSIIEHGDNYGQVRIENDGEIVTSFDFILLVKPFRGIDAVESTTEMNIFDKAVEQAEEAIDEAKVAALEEIAEAGSGNIAEEFNAANSYLAGEYTIYDAKLYRFTSNHTGSWSGSDAEEVTVGDELTDANEEITNLKDGLQDIEEEISHLDGLSEDVKQALLQIASKVAYIDEDGQDYYDALESALYPSVGLVSISAVYTQSGTVYDTDSLDSLKSDLVVTALYDDQTTETVTTYALSGTLTEGTSTITVSYGGKTTTFSVTVTAAPSYVTDGLFAQWDAIDNTGSAHDASATTWIDKINGYTWEAMKTDSTKTWAWDTDGLVFSPETTGSSGITQRKNTFKCTRPGTDLRTLEIVFSTDTADAQCLGEFTSNSSGISDANTQIIALASSDNTFITQGSQSSSFSVSSLSNIKSITATYNASKVPQKAYMNGSEVTTRGSSHSFKYHFYDNLILGAQNNSANLIYPFKGTIHAIRMYSKELTAEEIAYNYSLDVSRFGLGV